MRIALLIALAVSPAIAVADQTVIENNKTLTIDCAKDADISLIGNHNTITLTGPCKKLQITGNHETVKGPAKVVFVNGNDNTVALEATDEITVAGSNNTISWAQGAPKLTNSGKSNKLAKR